MKIQQLIALVLMATLFATPIVASYALDFPMMNLWVLFVEQLFGNFLVAILFIGLILFLILMLGGISYFTIILFLAYFYLAMAIGYGYGIIYLPITVFGVGYLIFQVLKWMENR